MILQEEEEEKYNFLRQLEAKDKALENMHLDPYEVKSNSLASCMFPYNDFIVFENHTTGIGSKLLKRMGYEGKGLGINGQEIINPIKVHELPCQERLGYVGKVVGECTREPVNHQK